MNLSKALIIRSYYKNPLILTVWWCTACIVIVWGAFCLTESVAFVACWESWPRYARTWLSMTRRTLHLMGYHFCDCKGDFQELQYCNGGKPLVGVVVSRFLLLWPLKRLMPTRLLRGACINTHFWNTRIRNCSGFTFAVTTD